LLVAVTKPVTSIGIFAKSAPNFLVRIFDALSFRLRGDFLRRRDFCLISIFRFTPRRSEAAAA
jgi:hypothetical protein